MDIPQSIPPMIIPFTGNAKPFATARRKQKKSEQPVTLSLNKTSTTDRILTLCEKEDWERVQRSCLNVSTFCEYGNNVAPEHV